MKLERGRERRSKRVKMKGREGRAAEGGTEDNKDEGGWTLEAKFNYQ